jgi:hypothetical protein
VASSKAKELVLFVGLQLNNKPATRASKKFFIGLSIRPKKVIKISGRVL